MGGPRGSGPRMWPWKASDRSATTAAGHSADACPHHTRPRGGLRRNFHPRARFLLKSVKERANRTHSLVQAGWPRGPSHAVHPPPGPPRILAVTGLRTAPRCPVWPGSAGLRASSAGPRSRPPGSALSAPAARPGRQPRWSPPYRQGDGASQGSRKPEAALLVNGRNVCKSSLRAGHSPEHLRLSCDPGQRCEAGAPGHGTGTWTCEWPGAAPLLGDGAGS